MLSSYNLSNLRRKLVFGLSFFLLAAGFFLLPKTSAHRQALEESRPPVITAQNQEASKERKKARFPASNKRTSRAAVIAGGGSAFLIDDGDGQPNIIPLKTSRPVFKAFGLTSDGRKLLYTPLKNGIPSGELLLEDLATGESQKLTSQLIIAAELSPADDRLAAYTFSTGGGFGLALIDLETLRTKVLVEQNVSAENIRWDMSGDGVFYYEIYDRDDGPKLKAGYVSTNDLSTNEIDPGNIPAGFPVLQQEKIPGPILNDESYSFRMAAPNGFYEAVGENLFGKGRLFTRNLLTGRDIFIGEGQLLKASDSGVAVKEFTPDGTEIKFFDWNGAARTVGTVTVDYNLPVDVSTLRQGGTGYSPPGSCSISSHAGAMEFAYDFRSTTSGKHILSSADGLVVYNTSSASCSGCAGSFLGEVLIVQHADGTYTKYAHLETDSQQAVVGTSVCTGLYIGRQGNTGSTGGVAHLHFQRQTSPDLIGNSIAVDFSDVASNPLSCGTTYTSASTEKSHSIAPLSRNFGTGGGTGSINVTSTGCSWSATSSESWITITSAGSGNGNDVVQYSVDDNSAGGPRTGTITVGGHIFTVTQSGGGVTNQAPTVNAGADQTITLPATAFLSGAASDDGLPNPPAALNIIWSKINGPGEVSFAAPHALNTTAGFTLAGIYTLRLTVSDGELTTSDDVTIVVNINNGGGTLTGSRAQPPSNINLTTEGTADWAHWGLTSPTDFNHKSGVVQQISNYMLIGDVTPVRLDDNSKKYTWSDGIPAVSATNTPTALFLYGVGNGFQITVPADTVQRTLKLYVSAFATGGRLEATISDGSASPYIDTSMISQATVDGVYTINYKAASSGQLLTVNWTIDSMSVLHGNITLQAATLAVTQPANQPPTVNAGADQTITLPASAALSGSATDDGLPNPPAALTTAWSKISGPGAVSFANADSLNTTASFSQAGTYVLRLTASDSALSTFDEVTVTVNDPGSPSGSLTAVSSSPPASVNLTAEGTADWTHWGLSGASSFNRKSGVSPQISNYTKIGTGSVGSFNDNSVLYSWSDGSPTGSAVNSGGALYFTGLNRGYELNIPADTNTRTLKLYVGVYAGQGRLEAILSDASASPVIDTSINNQTDTTNVVYTISYKAASAGQSLKVRWTAAAIHNSWGNVTLQAATLSADSGPPVNQAPVVNAGADQTITLPASAHLNGTASDDGLPSPPSMITTWSQTGGPGTVVFSDSHALNATASFSAPGTYILRLTADDGALSSFDEVQITVNDPGSSPGLLTAANALSPASVNLTTEGSADWTQWGLSNATTVNRKSGVPPQISNYTKIGSGSVAKFDGNSVSYSWNDGAPTNSASSDSAVYIMGLNRGFELDIPADTTQRTLKLYVGVYAGQGRFEASLSDASAPPVIDTSVSDQTDTTNVVYTINFKAASGGQNLKVRWTANAVFNTWGNVTLQAATLSGGGSGGGPAPASEFQISSSAPFAQYATHVASNAAGEFVVAWQSNLQDGSGWGIFARKYNADGTPLTGEFQVNTYTPDNQFVPRAALDASGNFVIVWESQNQDGSSYGIYGRRYNAAGVPLGGAFQINTYTQNSQHDPSIAMSPAGDFVVVWVSDFQDGDQGGIFGQRFDAAGNPQGGEFQVNTYTIDSQLQPTAAMDAAGNFVVGWESNLQDGSLKGIYGRRYNAAGVPLGGEFRVNTTTINDQSEHWTAMSPTGEFVFAWGSAGQDGSAGGIFAQRYDAAGVPLGNEFQVNTYTAGNQLYPVIAIDHNNDFVIVWESQNQDGSGKGVFGQRFNADGTPQGAEFLINSFTTNNQMNPFVAKDAAGNFIVVWTSSAQDGSGDGVFGKRFDRFGNPLEAP